MPDNLTIYPLPHDPEATALYWQDRAICVPQTAPTPETDPDVDEPDEPEQGHLPTGPTHVAARSTPKRTAAQLASARAFMAAAGHVKFDRGRATLKAVWMTFAYYASLGDGRVCFASIKTLADRALVSTATARRHVGALVARGLIKTDNRKGGHKPTTWTVHAFSPSVRGNQNDCLRQSPCVPKAITVTAEVSNRSTAPTERVLLASKQQPDGASAPPAALKNPAATNEQPKTETPAPTHTAGQTGGGAPRGATDKQIKYLKVLADRVGADHAEDLWRAADPKRLQAQMNAAKPFKDLKVKHVHLVQDEAAFRVGVEHKIGYKDVVQRCGCGAVRQAVVDRAGAVAVPENPWVLSGYLVDYLVDLNELHGPMTDAEKAYYREGDADVEALAGRWSVPMTFSEVKHLYETLPKAPKEWGDDCRFVPADWHTR